MVRAKSDQRFPSYQFPADRVIAQQGLIIVSKWSLVVVVVCSLSENSWLIAEDVTKLTLLFTLQDDYSLRFSDCYMVSRIFVYIGSGNGLSPFRFQAITPNSDDLQSIGSLRTNLSEIWIKMQISPFKRMHLKNVVCKMSAIFWKPRCHFSLPGSRSTKRRFPTR